MIINSMRFFVLILCMALTACSTATLEQRYFASNEISTEQDEVYSQLVGIYLTWNQNPTNSITVNWLDTRDKTSASVWYRPNKSGHAWQQVSANHRPLGANVAQIYRANLSALKPNTEYEFTIHYPKWEEESQAHTFKTLSTRLDPDFSFVVGGDMYKKRSTLDHMNQVAGRLNPSFALLGGDLAYANAKSSSRWLTWVNSWYLNARTSEGHLIPMVLAIGNHEVAHGGYGQTPASAPLFYSLFSLPNNKSYYDLIVGDYLQLIILDSDHTSAVEGAQKEWLYQRLQQPSQAFRFAAYHFPAYTQLKKQTENSQAEVHPLSLSLRKHWSPAFENYGVIAAFEHHQHIYKRSKPIRQGKIVPQGGVVYIGGGAWGVGTRAMPDMDFHQEYAAAYSQRHLLHVKLTSQNDVIVDAVDESATIIDTLELERKY